MLEKHKILIIGSGGMLGADLCEELGNGYDLVGSDLAPAKRAGATNFIECDITDKGSVKDVIDKVKPQIVIHAAAWTDVDGCERDREKAYRINASGTENVAVACKNAGAVLIYISTDFVFDGKKKEPYTEEDKTDPLNIYAASKLAGEEAVRKNLKEYFILRTSWLYGAGGKNFVDTIIAKAGTEKELKVVRDQAGSPTYTKDLACAIHRLADKIFRDRRQPTAAFGTYHVSNSGSVSWYDYACEILRLAGLDTKVKAITSAELARPAKRPAMSVLDNSKFASFTGYAMRDWKIALKEYIMKEKEKSHVQ